MKVKLKNSIIEDDVSIEGLFKCVLKHEIKETGGTLAWKGPKIPPEVWYAVTSFFKWTYDTSKSESQVRLYVSPTQQTWKAWAFPQEANTGMTAREIDNDAAKAQRAELNLNPPDWYLFGTVHHHCAMSAFQSGTDKENEKDQDGLHITIGKMDEKQYDIHSRFYRKGLCFDPDMSWFWDIGNVLDSCPEIFRSYIPKDYEDKFARKMMCSPVTADFPEVWKTNLITPPPPKIITPSTPYLSHTLDTNYSTFSSECVPAWKRGQNAWKEIMGKAVRYEITPEDLRDAFEELKLDGWAFNIIANAMLHHKVDLDDLERQAPVKWEDELAAELIRVEVEEALKDKQAADKENSNGAPGPGDEWAGYCT